MEAIDVVSHSTFVAVDLVCYNVTGTGDAVRNSARYACVGVEIVRRITDVTGPFDCTGGAELSGAVGVSLRRVGSVVAVGEAEQ